MTGFTYRTVTFCGRPFHASLITRKLCNSLRVRQNSRSGPTTPTWQRLPAFSPCRFRLYPVRSPLLGASLLFSLPRGTEMFHFPRFPLPALCVQAGVMRYERIRFSHSEIHGSMLAWQLPVAYRSLQRPSSASSAKASTGCPLQLAETMLALAMEFSRDDSGSFRRLHVGPAGTYRRPPCGSLQIRFAPASTP